MVATAQRKSPADVGYRVQTAAGDTPGMEDDEKAEWFWPKRSVTAESWLQTPTSVLSRRSFPTPRQNRDCQTEHFFAFAGHWRSEEDRIDNAVGGRRATWPETVRKTRTATGPQLPTDKARNFVARREGC